MVYVSVNLRAQPLEPVGTGWNRLEPVGTGWNRLEPVGTGWNQSVRLYFGGLLRVWEVQPRRTHERPRRLAPTVFGALVAGAAPLPTSLTAWPVLGGPLVDATPRLDRCGQRFRGTLDSGVEAFGAG